MTERAVILMPFIRSGFDTDVFHTILIRVKIKIFYHKRYIKLLMILASFSFYLLHTCTRTMSINDNHYETDKRKYETQVYSRHTQQCMLVNNTSL